MKRVTLESPFASDTVQGRKDNITYLRRCLRDSLMRGEAPFASHAIYTQHGVLDDDKAEERGIGLTAAMAYVRTCDLVAIYMDHGISPGMKRAINEAENARVPIEFRSLKGTM